MLDVNIGGIMKNTAKEKYTKRINILKILYVMSLIGMLSLVVVIHITSKKPDNISEQPTYQDITTS